MEEITFLTFENGLHIEWKLGDDGGGSSQYIDFIEPVRNQNKIYTYGLEWCAGLSAIGFMLIDQKLCKKIVFMDKYEPSLTNALANAERNNCSNLVEVICIDEIQKIPFDYRFDLIVANPPHGTTESSVTTDDKNEFEYETVRRVTLDIDWKIHKEFFQNITKYLLPNADVFISETYLHEPIIKMADEVGLNFIRAYDAIELKKVSNSPAVILHFRYET